MARTIPADNLYMLSTADRLPLIAAMFIRAASVVTEWDRRSRTRQQLKHLDKHLLEDIGITESQALKEQRKRFYQI
ncbi:MAG: DUF1127 domain-containing protein [Heliomarina sp.]|uniref:DUF1127 domain-containing protein n=1 Tax=Heliomarina sp. TaxID=2917556 RepID=UPI0040582F3E|nr:DUF1127 domain-containing protein [Paracoccaceae bacterium]